MTAIRTPASKRTTTKKVPAAVSAELATGTAKAAAPKARAKSTASTTRTARPKQAEETIETGRPRAARKAAAEKIVSTEERYRMIAAAAYFLAERHDFSSGRALEDWIAAEKEIDVMLKSGN